MTPPSSKNALPWQSIANWLFGALITLGGYLWSQTATTVTELQTRSGRQGESIAALRTTAANQDRQIDLLRTDLQRANDKLDRLLERVGYVAQPAFPHGGPFDK